ncbi:hypothetical protein E3I90_04055 [Candidatus Bathyarchaeota archaeon]|nr:MAG: hypothetical protein E3I90_04055 [Candidatus Bathyarchaeota archaeon]
MSEAKKCYPQCEVFRCAKKALEYRGNTAWCEWTEEECNVSNCTYATCIKRRLLPEGICGETLKRKTTEIEPEEAVGPPVKLKGKALRRVGEKEIF